MKQPEGEWSEAKMTVNGTELSPAQSMTIRVALNVFSADLSANGLGDDEHGRLMTKGYQDRVREVMALIHEAKP